jgi:hypothetical protein
MTTMEFCFSLRSNLESGAIAERLRDVEIFPR